jgi:hypothetical protein
MIPSSQRKPKVSQSSWPWICSSCSSPSTVQQILAPLSAFCQWELTSATLTASSLLKEFPYFCLMHVQLRNPTKGLCFDFEPFVHLTAAGFHRPECLTGERPPPDLPFPVQVYWRVGWHVGTISPQLIPGFHHRGAVGTSATMGAIAMPLTGGHVQRALTDMGLPKGLA